MARSKAALARYNYSTLVMRGLPLARPSSWKRTAVANSDQNRNVPRMSASLATSCVIGRLTSPPMPMVTGTPRWEA